MHREKAFRIHKFAAGNPADVHAALTVLASRQAIVIGPTPPGTGVIAPATSRASSYATSPKTRRLPSRDSVDADVDHRRTRLDLVAPDEFRAADRGKHEVRPPADRRQMAGLGMRDSHGRALGDEELSERLADNV
jgi:hypothetical protein